MTRTSAPGLRGLTEKQRELGADDEDPAAAAAAAELVTASPDLPWRRASGAPPGLVVAIERVGSTASSRCRHPPCLLYSDNPRGAQLWIRGGSCRGASPATGFIEGFIISRASLCSFVCNYRGNVDMMISFIRYGS